MTNANQRQNSIHSGRWYFFWGLNTESPISQKLSDWSMDLIKKRCPFDQKECKRHKHRESLFHALAQTHSDTPTSSTPLPPSVISWHTLKVAYNDSLVIIPYHYPYHGIYQSLLSWPESIEWFIEDQPFSPSSDLAPPSLSASLPVCRWSNLMTGEGVREEPNHRSEKPGPL